MMMKRKVIVLFLETRIHFESKVSHISYDKLKITKVQALLLGKNFFLYQATVLFFRTLSVMTLTMAIVSNTHYCLLLV